MGGEKKVESWFVNIRQNILEYLEKNNLTYAQFAELAGLSVDTIQSYMGNKPRRKPQRDTLIKLAKVLNKPVDELIGEAIDTIQEYQREKSPKAILKNLYYAAKDARLEIYALRGYGVVMRSSNQFIIDFFSEVQALESFLDEIKDEDIEKLIDIVLQQPQMDNNGIVMDGSSYELLKRAQYVFGDMTKEDDLLNGDEIDEYVRNKKMEYWERRKTET